MNLGSQHHFRLAAIVSQRLWLLLWRLLPLLLGICALPSIAAPLVLEDKLQRIEVWSHVSMLSDPEGRISINEAIKWLPSFHEPRSAFATLGIKPEPVWLHIPVMVTRESDGEWILDIDYALLNRVDVHVVTQGKVAQHHVTGNDLPFEERPIVSRTPAVKLALAPGLEHDIYIKVDTIGARILPITFNKFSAFHRAGINEQMLQGLLTCLAICPIIFSLMHWVSMREALYLKYALLVTGSLLFSLHFFGIGEQYIWTDIDWIEKRLAGVSSLIAAAATALFIEDVLGSDMSRTMRRALYALATLLGLAALAHAMDAISIRTVGYLMTTIGVLPSLLGVPGAMLRMQRGDWVGLYFLVAWIGYFIASAIMVGVVRGKLDANFWTLHSFQIGATIDMLIFLRIAILRSAAIHHAAQRATRERDSLISLAHTDPLTGLLNRRGLHDVLSTNLPRATPERMLAVYMLDLDQFKPINDQYGHDVGDELLVVVASRLRGTVRGGDVIARLGGDEFVVTASGLANEQQAHELGAKLVAALSSPFVLEGNNRQAPIVCNIGGTAGYAISPKHGHDPVVILKLADAAMYQGKQRGKNCAMMATVFDRK